MLQFSKESVTARFRPSKFTTYCPSRVQKLLSGPQVAASEMKLKDRNPGGGGGVCQARVLPASPCLALAPKPLPTGRCRKARGDAARRGRPQSARRRCAMSPAPAVPAHSCHRAPPPQRPASPTPRLPQHPASPTPRLPVPPVPLFATPCCPITHRSPVLVCLHFLELYMSLRKLWISLHFLVEYKWSHTPCT